MKQKDSALPVLPALPIILASFDAVVWIAVDGTVETLAAENARDRLERQPALFCHRRFTAARLGMEAPPHGTAARLAVSVLEGLDALELFAFVRPGQFCLPTPAGLAAALGLAEPQTAEDQAITIGTACQLLLGMLGELDNTANQRASQIASMMAGGGWGWAATVLACLGRPMPPPAPPDGRQAAIWHRLADIPEPGPRPKPGQHAVTAGEAANRLTAMLGRHSEARPAQRIYTECLSAAFQPPGQQQQPALVLAEAGTGTGKTLGYLAPATLWAERNNAAVWVSTYTRSLQHQVADELSRLLPDREERQQRVVIRKGRENYLCLLNLEDALGMMPGRPAMAVGLGLMARWAEVNPDGDLTGAGFPAWLIDLLGTATTLGLADRRGECIHSACPHYGKCFGERAKRRATEADIVIANHALVMISAALDGLLPAPEETSQLPTRLIFDEGHHVFDAADSAFSIVFSGTETADLRRWIRGNEESGRGRARGLKRRLEELVAGDPLAIAALDAAIEAARILPATGWRKRLSANTPQGKVEVFFQQLRQQLYAHSESPGNLYDLQAGLWPMEPMLKQQLEPLRHDLEQLAVPLRQLASRLETVLQEGSDSLDSSSRVRLEAAIRGLLRRCAGPLASWQQLLADISQETQPETQPAGKQRLFVDWMQASRRNGEDIDIGIHRHWLDPTIPFAGEVLRRADGAVITSATLTDKSKTSSDLPDRSDWAAALDQTGARHLQTAPSISAVASPFDYAGQTRLLIVNDVARDRPADTAAAMAALMQAAGGGGLGLFTAIRRLRETHGHLAPLLEAAGLPLYAQHMDAMNLQTLLQIFRAERRSCLLGTDAVRDGIDVPGQALQLIIFDRVPWPRPDALYKARAEHFGRQEWTDRLTRLRLRQAFGRLVRRADDRGVFIMLDSRLPSRLLGAFPAAIEARRCGLAEAIAETRDFLAPG